MAIYETESLVNTIDYGNNGQLIGVPASVGEQITSLQSAINHFKRQFNPLIV